MGLVTLAEIPVPADTLTFVTVPTEKVLLTERSRVTPFIVIVRVVGTGVYPRAPIISKAVTRVAEVTKPFALTANFKNVLGPYTSIFTGSSVRVTGEPVIPDPVTSPVNIRTPEGTVMRVLTTFVTSPLLFTVILGTIVEVPNVPIVAFTVANVNTADPGPLAVPSPVRAVR